MNSVAVVAVAETTLEDEDGDALVVVVAVVAVVETTLVDEVEGAGHCRMVALPLIRVVRVLLL